MSISRIIGVSVSPNLVILYSVLGGITGYIFFSIILSLSNSLSCSDNILREQFGIIGVLLRNAREIDGIAQILGRELLPALGGSDGGSGFVRRWGSRLGGTAGGQTCRESHRCYDSGNPPERPFHIKPLFLSCRFLFFHCNTF